MEKLKEKNQQIESPKSQFYHTFARSTRTILRKGCTQHHQNVDFTTVSRDRHVRSYERVALSTAKSQFYYSFARSTRTILRKGSSSPGKIAILLQFRAFDTYDLTKGLIQLRQDRNFTTVSRDRHVRSYEKGSSSSGKIAILLQFRAIDVYDLTKGLIQLRQDRNFTTVSRDRCVRSYERVHPAPARSQFYYSFARSMSTILRKGSSSSGKIAILLHFRAIDVGTCERVAFPQAFSGPRWPPP